MTHAQSCIREDKIHRIPWSGCWVWTGTTVGLGYGQMWFRGRKEYAHRCSWIEHKGDIPEGLSVLHECDVRTCMNPDHLFLGTQADNVRDMMEKGRGRYKTIRGKAHPKSVLDYSEADKMLLDSKTMSYRELMAKYNVCKSTVECVKNGKHWTMRDRI